MARWSIFLTQRRKDFLNRAEMVFDVPPHPILNSYPHPACGHPLPSDGRGTGEETGVGERPFPKQNIGTILAAKMHKRRKKQGVQTEEWGQRKLFYPRNPRHPRLNSFSRLPPPERRVRKRRQRRCRPCALTRRPCPQPQRMAWPKNPPRITRISRI
jgi:hypothetical protein